jgi:hypothetical protein
LRRFESESEVDRSRKQRRVLSPNPAVARGETERLQRVDSSRSSDEQNRGVPQIAPFGDANPIVPIDKLWVGRVDHGMIHPKDRSRRGPQMSPTPDSTLANPEQRIADLERQLAEREAELAEALQRETATAEVLQVINSSPGDLAPVFEALLDKALTVCGGTFGIIRTYDGNSFHFGAMRGVPPEIAELMKQPIRPPLTGMVALERLVAGEPVVEIADSRDVAGYRAGAPTIRAMADRGGARTGLWVALRRIGTRRCVS